MTREQREQAAQVLESIWTRYISTFDDIESEEVDAIDTAIAVLREPVLDENGLAPCGCGERVDVAFYPGRHGVPDMYQVDCFNCHVGTRPCQTEEQAKSSWNTAMGWKE